MPITYQQSPQPDVATDSTANFSSNPIFPDTDSSIVLSDLLRSGETSRLRRRGAVRLDHTHRHEDARGSSNAENTVEEDQSCFRLFCRECETPSPSSSTLPSGPYQPSPFPLPPSKLINNPSGNKLESPERTLIHTRVKAQRLPHIDASLHVHPPSGSTYPPTSAQVFAVLARMHHSINTRSVGDSDDADTENGVFVWTSVSEPVDNVVPMYYDDDSDQISDAMVENDSKFMTIEELARHRPGPISTACMCKREVVGCAVCGSPLGMRYSPCSSAVKKIFPPFGHIASPPHPRRTFISSRSPAVYPSSYPRPASLDADAESYRSRVADYLLAMSTPRSTRTAPSPPDTVRLTPEMHNESDHSRPFEVSILPRRVSSQNHQRQPSSSSREPLNGSTRLHSRPSAIEDYRNEVQSEPQQRPLQTLESLVTELTETETIDSETEAESDNDDHYRLPMITQTPLGRDSGCPSGHWARGSPERHVYRFFAEAVVAEALSKKTSLEESTGCPPSMTDWRRLYASLYGLGLRSEGDDRRLSCG